jgi:hypothetical protein
MSGFLNLLRGRKKDLTKKALYYSIIGQLLIDLNKKPRLGRGYHKSKLRSLKKKIR